ncbi:hypothetical protein PT2222_410017 [Paraburkholderia tropica]
MRRFPGANFPEFAALHFGIRNLRVSTADKLARWPINQRFPSERFLRKNENQNVLILDYFSTEIAEEVKGNSPTESLIWGTSATTRQARG